MDSYSANLSFGFIKKFNHFLPVLLHDCARLYEILRKKEGVHSFGTSPLINRMVSKVNLLI